MMSSDLPAMPHTSSQMHSLLLNLCFASFFPLLSLSSSPLGWPLMESVRVAGGALCGAGAHLIVTLRTEEESVIGY